jgi:hypothetical protein
MAYGNRRLVAKGEPSLERARRMSERLPLSIAMRLAFGLKVACFRTVALARGPKKKRFLNFKEEFNFGSD